MKSLIPGILVVLNLAGFAQSSPSIGFTLVPDWGKSDLLEGRVHHTTLSDHGVAVYIFVEEAGGWWTKPLASNPVTTLRPDSGFSTNIVIGGLDQFATKIIAFLIPLSFSPPVLLGMDLPEVLFAYPYAISCRPHGDRKISWSGYEWTVKRSVGTSLLPIGPGPNIFNDNDSMVWVDQESKLHLRIAKKGNAWHCSELICNASMGYRRYNFDAGSRFDLFDQNIIAGIFTWDDCAAYATPPEYFYREIDFEFSKWGIPGNQDAQFVIQPYYVPGNLHRFNMDLSGLDHSLHYFDWSPDSIVFNSTWGDSSHTWKYLNSGGIPGPGNENLRINLHLLNGDPPSDNMNAGFVLNSFVTGIESQKDGNVAVKIFPNPFEESCMIEIPPGRRGDLEIGVLDLQGKIIKMFSRGNLLSGQKRIEWDGKTGQGKVVQPGLYIIYFRDVSSIKYAKIIKM